MKKVDKKINIRLGKNKFVILNDIISSKVNTST